jgi:nucleotide-binding universal stress UspA family protein
VKAVAARHWPQRSEVRIVNGFAVLPLIDGDYANAVLAEWIADEKARVAEMIETAVARLKRSELKVSKVMKPEGARQLLISEAKSWEADCIFVGARGMGAVERFLIGSVSSYVATHAPCSVEVVPEEK